MGKNQVPKRPSAIAVRLDEMDARIIGKLRLKELRAGATENWQRRILDEAISAFPEIQWVRPAPTDLPHVHTSDRLKPHFGQLKSWGVLGERKGRRRAVCGLFTVLKTNGYDRLVFDARQANLLIQGGIPFSLFMLADLLWAMERLRNLGASRKGVFVVLRDFRHWFYQFKLPAVLQNLFVVAGDYVPLVMAMGYTRAPAIGQGATWSIVLFREPGESSLGAPERVPEFPTFIALHLDGKLRGYIFVLIDNIMICTIDEALAELWSKRVNRNAKKFHAIFKVEGEEAQNSHLDPLEAEPQGVLSLQGNTTAVFAGIEFGSQGWRTKEGTIPAPSVRMNVRECARVLGQCYWELRVRLEPLSRIRDLVNLSRLIGIQAHITNQDWSVDIDVPEAGVKAVRAVIDVRNGRTWTTLPEFPPAHLYTRIVVDATPWRLAGVWMDTHGNVIDAYVETFVQSQPIAVMEARAISQSLLRWEPAFAVVATDSEVARGVFEKGHSTDPVLDSVVAGSWRGPGRVECVRVASEANAADTPTRWGEIVLVEARLDRTHAVFESWMEKHQ